MHYTGSTLDSNTRDTFWARPPSLVFTWPVLLGLLLLLLVAGVIAVAHQLRPRRRRSLRPLQGVSAFLS